ncbi:hypothetical protein EDD16DRAFT_1529510 [Pisolithus croceorrhizus]|nr:hypothetical protein EDD16DRAFT_1529510 [Pisolithus croceorrhizus]
MSFATSTIHTAVYNDLLAVYCSTPIHSVFAGIAGVLALRSTLRTGRTELKTTSLRGPSGAYPMFGASKDLFEALDIGEIFETSAKEYGVASEFRLVSAGRRSCCAIQEPLHATISGKPGHTY